jgi:hypothetical protein
LPIKSCICEFIRTRHCKFICKKKLANQPTKQVTNEMKENKTKKPEGCNNLRAFAHQRAVKKSRGNASVIKKVVWMLLQADLSNEDVHWCVDI